MPFRMSVIREAIRWSHVVQDLVKSLDRRLQTVLMAVELSMSMTTKGSGSGYERGTELRIRAGWQMSD